MLLEGANDDLLRGGRVRDKKRGERRQDRPVRFLDISTSNGEE
jgi:hypothetical protein